MQELFDFIDQNPTAFHVVENVSKRLETAMYSELSEGEEWRLSKGRKCYVKRNGSSLIAFAIPKGEIKGFHIFSAHTDSPSFRLKENAEVCFEDNYVRLNVEKYGGMILSSWLDRPLSVAGRVVVKGKDGLEEKLVNVDRDLLQIPNVAIHMNGDLNKGYTYSVQSDMLPLFSGAPKGKLDEMIANAAGVSKDDILGRDLFLYPRQKGTLIGADGEFAVSARLDDQACVFAGLKGLLESGDEGKFIRVLALFDNEEVGSGTKQGADSTFLEDTLYKIAESIAYSETGYKQLLFSSFMASADNAHAVHPAFSGKADPTNRPYLNKGIVLKFNGNQRYATDAVSAAYFRDICNEAGVNVQTYANQSDIPGGSTLGNISTAHVSVKTADIGLPQLSMHSACETMGARDLNEMVKFATAFFNK